MKPLLPVFVKLEDKPVLVVGAGPVAAAKLPALLEAGAAVTVVAPEVRSEFERADVRIVRRSFVPADLDGIWYVVAAAPPEVNHEVARLASERRIFVNAVDEPENATAYLGAVLRRDGLTLAISTSGAAPALAGLVREGLDAVLPRDVAAWNDVARMLRNSWRRDRVPLAERRPLLLTALNRLYESRTAAAAQAGSA
ncbi:MAG: bifunctional precorrin-2 dehydrogenase/sirohydrochlorin ferrochelatase [Thermoanaerobaculia bacterium]|nr:bifunctional precorrin-2 dehydrogenase/sirohydrochlorin ferrochelatase [Thermoanaerobaculia bacterium]